MRRHRDGGNEDSTSRARRLDIADTRGISPVIGISLLMAIVVVLASLSGAMLFGLAEEQPPAPTVSFSTNATVGAVNLTHEQGATLTREHVDVVLKADATTRRTNLADPSGLVGQLGDGNDAFITGETASVSHSLLGTVEILVIHKPSQAIIWRDTVQIDPVVLDVIRALDETAGATNVDHVATTTVQSGLVGETFKEVTITYPSSTVDLSDTANSQSNFYVLGVDTDRDGDVEVQLSDDIGSMSLNNNNKITVGVSTTYTFEENDRLIVKYHEVDNPAATGDYSVDVTIRTEEGSSQTETGTLTITS